jgi:hypothetical protein
MRNGETSGNDKGNPMLLKCYNITTMRCSVEVDLCERLPLLGWTPVRGGLWFPAIQ